MIRDLDPEWKTLEREVIARQCGALQVRRRDKRAGALAKEVEARDARVEPRSASIVSFKLNSAG